MWRILMTQRPPQMRLYYKNRLTSGMGKSSFVSSLVVDYFEESVPAVIMSSIFTPCEPSFLKNQPSLLKAQFVL